MSGPDKRHDLAEDARLPDLVHDQWLIVGVEEELHRRGCRVLGVIELAYGCRECCVHDADAEGNVDERRTWGQNRDVLNSVQECLRDRHSVALDVIGKFPNEPLID